MSNTRFIHLRLHSSYSLLEGAISLKSLPKMCQDAKMPAVAVTDTGNLFGALEFSETAAKAGVQPIIGAEFNLRIGDLAAPLVLLSQNEAGYLNLLELSSFNYLEANDELPHVTLAKLLDHSDGLILLTGGAEGGLAQLLANGKAAEAEELIAKLKGAFDNRIYIEIQRHQVPGANRTAYEAHDALICIADGAYVDQQEPRRVLTPEHYFKDQHAMAELFADLPEAIENTVEIAKRCAFRPRLRDPILPKFAEDEVEELKRQSREGLKARLAVIPHAPMPPRLKNMTSVWNSSWISFRAWAFPVTS